MKETLEYYFQGIHDNGRVAIDFESNLPKGHAFFLYRSTLPKVKKAVIRINLKTFKSELKGITIILHEFGHDCGKSYASKNLSRMLRKKNKTTVKRLVWSFPLSRYLKLTEENIRSERIANKRAIKKIYKVEGAESVMWFVLYIKRLQKSYYILREQLSDLCKEFIECNTVNLAELRNMYPGKVMKIENIAEQRVLDTYETMRIT